LRDLDVEDERSFTHVGLYRDLKQILVQDGAVFRVPAAGASALPWARVSFLNLTFWNAAEPNDVLPQATIPADVVAHVGWHHLARLALGRGGASLGADALLLGESIASAFDLYLVGRLLGHAPESSFLETQVPAMADAAEAAGLSEEGFEALLEGVAADPERSFAELRELLFDASTALVRARGVDHAAEVLAALDGRRLAPLLHHYELSNWVLYARAYAPPGESIDPRVAAVDAALRRAPVALDWLEAEWVRPALGEP
jgi:hypothetical protein